MNDSILHTFVEGHAIIESSVCTLVLLTTRFTLLQITNKFAYESTIVILGIHWLYVKLATGSSNGRITFFLHTTARICHIFQKTLNTISVRIII